MQRYIVQNIKLPFEASKDVVLAQAKRRLLKFFAKKDIVRAEIAKRSVDARKKNDIKFVWSVWAEIASDEKLDASRLAAEGIALSKSAALEIKHGDESLSGRPLIVGFGPCGMFCALILARNGYRPIVIERGADVNKRASDVETFMKTGKLDAESNVQFGAGGAGTFSDGKLVTRINDPKCSLVIDEMHRHGAPDDVLFLSKPHVGTDVLKSVVASMHDEITSLGGEIHYNTRFDGFISRGSKIVGVRTSRGDIGCGAVVIAVGHSARDTFDVFDKSGLSLTPKAFSVGVRIEHLQKDIDAALYGDHAGDPRLPKGEYTLSHKCGDGRGVYSFCMCPGGEVVAATSEEGSVVTNGMSRHARDGVNANSAIAVSVLPDDFGGSVRGAVEFQRKIERAAFVRAGKTYAAPAQTVGDFLSETHGSPFTDVFPTYMNGNVAVADFDGIFPTFVTDSLKEGLTSFDRAISGFAKSSAVLTAPETRTSSPVRILRGEGFVAEGFDNVYPCGEGAGYAGGITSAGVDGINCALKIIERYAPAILKS